MGDPKETIRRAALNLHESLHSHTPQTLRQPGSLLHDLNTPEVQHNENICQKTTLINQIRYSTIKRMQTYFSICFV